jgi:DNA-binding beta-propeller fold protein YncE
VSRSDALRSWQEDGLHDEWSLGDSGGAERGLESGTAHDVLRACGFAIASRQCHCLGASQPQLGGGAIYLGSYAKRILIVDEATEKVSGDIPLATGIPWSVRLSPDGTRFYIASADQDHVEIVDVASRKSLQTVSLSEGRKKVRILAFAADPQHHVMTLLTRSSTKPIDRFEIGPPMFVQYDLVEHKVIREVPWSGETEPGFFFELRYSPDGKSLYAFTDEVLIFDPATLQQVATWNLSLPNEPGLGHFDVGWVDDANDDPAYFNGLFTLEDKLLHRRLLVVGRVNLGERDLDFFPLGPVPQQGRLSFALGPDRKRGYVLLQDIRHHELWTIDIPGKRLLKKTTFEGRPRMAVRVSSNGKLLYLYEAGNTIDLYDAADFKYLRTITLDADMTYDSFHVIGPRSPASRSTVQQ